MKKSILVSSLFALAGAAVAIYIWRKRKSAEADVDHSIEPRSHHLTKVFARAKAHQTS